MTNEEWLEANAKLVDSTIPDDLSKIWVSKIDESYLTHEGSVDNINHIVDRGLTQVQNMNNVAMNSANIGFSEDEQKWYGWSHRAFYGFGIGSEVNKGDCAYIPQNEDDYLDTMIKFWTEDGHVDVTGSHREDDAGVEISWRYADDIPNERLRSQISGCFHEYPNKYGLGAWTAETLEDARQMACDFAEGVS